MIRCFICLELPREIRDLIDSHATAILRKTGARCSTVRADNLHLTLKFLGDIEEGRIDKLSRALEGAFENAIGNAGAFSLSLENIGSFGGKSPRVVWIGLGGETARLSALADSIDKAFAVHGFEREKRPFKPHLTIARVREGAEVEALSKAIREVRLPRREFTAERLILMKSTLSPTGSIYEPLAKFVIK